MARSGAMDRLALALLLAVSLNACKHDKCKDQPPSLEIDVTASGTVTSGDQPLVVQLTLGSDHYRKTFDLGDQLFDGVTSLAVDVQPAPSGAFTIGVQVDARSKTGGMGDLVGTASSQVTATADGCNQVPLALGVYVPDAGFF